MWYRYAIGGHDGTTMIPSIEIYDPLLGTWTIGEPMNQGRGYLATAVFKECIFAIGGIDSNEDIVDKVNSFLPTYVS